MASNRHYANAPISEALIDIQVQFPPEVSLAQLDGVSAAVRDHYPTKKSRVSFEGQFSTGEEVAASARQTCKGFAFYSPDGKQVFQARLDGFTFSRLRPYGSWEQLRDEAKRLWDVYKTELKPLRMTRVAVRYINRIDMPLPMADFGEYLRTLPQVSPSLPQALSGFFMQLQFPQIDFGGQVVLTQTMVSPPRPLLASVVLDIDVFKPDAGLSSDSEAWSLLELLRDRKNDFFEGCITDKTRSLFTSEIG